MATATKNKPSTKDRVLELARAAGADGISNEDLATQTGVSKATVTKAVKALVEESKVKVNDDGLVTAKGRIGRRSAEVVERDDKILAFISEKGAEGTTLEDIAENCDTTKRLAYESVWRLRANEKVRREGATRTSRWVAA